LYDKYKYQINTYLLTLIKTIMCACVMIFNYNISGLLKKTCLFNFKQKTLFFFYLG